MNALAIKQLRVRVEGKEILRGVDLSVKQGEVHAVMGPNGSGKSTLAQTLMGHPAYTVMRGAVRFRGKNVLRLAPEERARLGIFLSFQHPMEVSGVPFLNFLRAAYNATSAKKKDVSAVDFVALVRKKVSFLGFGSELIERNLNEGLSGGEKKRAEILQMAVLSPKLAVLDETDSGLDIDALRSVARGIEKLRKTGMSIIVITHYQRILRYLKPDRVHVMVDGKIIASGDRRLAMTLEKKGYGWLTRETTPALDSARATSPRMRRGA